jgi:hypothetical protein
MIGVVQGGKAQECLLEKHCCVLVDAGGVIEEEKTLQTSTLRLLLRPCRDFSYLDFLN